MASTPKLVDSQRLFSGRVFSVRTDTVRTDGKEHRLDIVEHPGSFAIAAVPEGGGLVLVRQYRHAAGVAMWKIPAGTAEREEDCESGARRELREETGFSADDWRLLCIAYPTPGYSTERVHLYQASALRAGPAQPDEDEDIEVRAVTLEHAWKMQASGEIADMKTLLALFWLSKGAFV